MEAKDTLMHVVDLIGGKLHTTYVAMRDNLVKQAEISFKAGQDSMLKEVKEWMDENCLGCRSNTPCNTDEYLGFHKESWQAFLKGLEGDKLNANRRSY